MGIKVMAGITGVITAVSAVVLALTGLVTAIKGILPLLRSQQRTEKNVKEVHDLVNNRSDRQDQRIEQLTDALNDSDTEVPPLKKVT